MIAFMDVTINGKLDTVEINSTTADELKAYDHIIQKAGLVPINKKFDYFWIRDRDENILAFAAIYFKDCIATFKADYTFPEYRKNGLWEILFQYRKFICETKPEVKAIEATCTKMSIGLYTKYGAEIVKKFKSDLWKIRIPLEKGN